MRATETQANGSQLRRPGDDVGLVSRLMDGYMTTQLLNVAATLGIADVLGNGARTSAEIAAVVDADPIVLHRVLRGLAAEGVLDEQADGRFGLTPAGALLRADVPGSLRGSVLMRGGMYYQAATGLHDAVRRGGSAMKHVYGMHLFEYLAQHPEDEANFQQSMAARGAREAEDVVAAYDFSGFRRMVDVGGGQGTLVAAILRRTSELHAVLFDLPAVVEQARPRLARAGMLDRCELTGGDFFDAVPAGGDLYVLSRVLHDWDDAAAVRILRRCHAAMPEGATLLLAEAVMPKRATDQPVAIRMDVHMLTLLGGRERTAAEYQALLEAAGFRPAQVVPTCSPAGVSLIEAVR